MKPTLTIALSILLGSLVLPCLADAPYTVDSPSTVEAKHHFLSFNYTSSSGGGKETETAPGVTYKYGISRVWEFKLDTGLYTIHKAGKAREAGLADTNLQLKWRFHNETKKTPALSFAYKFKVPTADKSRGLGSGAPDNSVCLSIGKSFGRYRLYGNAGYTFAGTTGAKKIVPNENSSFYGMVLTYQATEHLVVGAQVYGNSPKASGQKDELAWSVGASYKYAPDHTVFACVGKSEHGFSNLNVNIGMSLVFK